VRLTAAGRVLVEHTEKILAQLREAEAEMRAVAHPHGGELRIATFPSAAATLLPPALADFSRGNPDVALAIVESDPVTGAVGVKTGEYDLALGWEYDFVPVSPGKGLERVALLDDPIHVLLPVGHPAASAPAVDLADLADTPWITSTPRSSCNPFTRRACASAGFEPRVVAETDDHHVLQRLVAGGVGAALESELSLRDLRSDVAVVPLVHPLKRRIFAVHREAASPHVATLAEALRRAATPHLRAVEEPVAAA
jgi:DNA-binding transcriptional LysR family regulator